MLTGGRLRVQPLGRSRRHALARGRHPRRLGVLRLPARRRRAATCGPPATSRAASSRTATRSRSARTAPSSSGATDRSPRRSRSSSPRRTTPRCAASPSRTRGAAPREIEVTSYAELVLAPPAADTAHPAFSKLFVQTEHLARGRRAPRDAAASLARRARGLGGARRRRRGRDGGRAGARDRPGPLPRPRVRGPGADRGDGRPAALQHRRHRPRPRLRAAPAREGAAGQRRRASRSGRWSRRRAPRRWT